MGTHHYVPTTNGIKLFYRNTGNLNIHIFRQTTDLHRFAGRGISGEILSIDLIDLWEIVHVFQEDGALHHIAEGHPGRLKDVFQVHHYLFRLFFDRIFQDVAGGALDGDLTTDKKHISRLDSLAVRTDRFRGGRGINNCF